MFPPPTKAIASVLSLAILSVVVECTSFIVPDQIAANTNFQVDIGAELTNATGYDAYRVLLAIDIGSALEKFDSVDEGTRLWSPSCYLAKSIPIASANPALRIPSSVGADGVKYAMPVEAYNTDDLLVEPSSGYVYGEKYNLKEWPSEVFSVTGGTGKWTVSSLENVNKLDYIDPINVPCTAWDCARDCTSTYAGETSTIRILGNDYPTSWRDSWNCIRECPAVTYPPFHVLFGVDEDYNEIITSTVLGPLSTTATKTIFTTSISFQGVSPTGTGTLATATPFSNSTATVSGLSSTTSSRINTPTIAPTPSPTKNVASNSGLDRYSPLFGCLLAAFVHMAA